MSGHLSDQMQQRSRSFDAWALEYDRFRPTYPQSLFDYIAQRLSLPADAQVADLGSGTGKAARAMARRGWRVTAVEPGEGMFEVLRARAVADGLLIDARLAGAEDTALPNASFDLVTAAQAFHWFDKPRAVAEMARIVRPSGGVAVFWNARADDRSPFLAAYTELMATYIPDEHVDRRERGRAGTAGEDLAQGGLFEVDDRVELHHSLEMDAERFIGYVFTASYTRLFIDDDAQQRLRADLAALIGRQFGDGPVVVPYDIDLYIGSRTAKEPDRD